MHILECSERSPGVTFPLMRILLAGESHRFVRDAGNFPKMENLIVPLPLLQGQQSRTHHEVRHRACQIDFATGSDPPTLQGAAVAFLHKIARLQIDPAGQRHFDRARYDQAKPTASQSPPAACPLYAKAMPRIQSP
jgi:hypothetical protein